MLFDKTLGVGVRPFIRIILCPISQTFVNKCSFQQLFSSLSSTGEESGDRNILQKKTAKGIDGAPSVYRASCL